MIASKAYRWLHIQRIDTDKIANRSQLKPNRFKRFAGYRHYCMRVWAKGHPCTHEDPYAERGLCIQCGFGKRLRKVMPRYGR